MNFGHPKDNIMGWAVLLVLLQTMWLPEDPDSVSQTMDWILMLGDDVMLAAGFMMLMETHPSVCLGSLGKNDPLEDYQARGEQALRVAESLGPVDWEEILRAVGAGLLLFPMDLVIPESTAVPDEDDQEDLALRSVPGPAPAMELAKESTPKKKRTSPKPAADGAVPSTPKPRSKAAPKAAKPKAGEPTASSSSTPTCSPPASAKPSALKARLGIGAGLRR